MKKSIYVLTVMLFLVLGISPVCGAVFYDDFNSATLDPAWSIVEYSGSYPRAQGYTSPANHYSLTDNPGSLRYYVDPMTYNSGYVNSYQTLDSSTYTYYYDPGLEIHRDISGDSWVFESKVDYYIPYANARGFVTNIYFGDGVTKTYRIEFTRLTDIHTHNSFSVLLREYNGSDWTQYTVLASETIDLRGLPYDEHSTYYSRLERSGGVLTAMWSTDGLSWNESFSVDLGNQLDGLSQKIVLVGNSWFRSLGAYAEYDYVSVSSEYNPMEVAIDIKPESCPNPLRVNFRGRGVIPVAIVGSEDFDVLTIDVATITLQGVAPIRSNYADVSTPSEGEECECTTLGQDGFLDLTLKFDRETILNVLEESLGDLGEIPHRTEIPLTLDAMLLKDHEDDPDVALQGTDCLTILNRGAIKRKK